MNEDNKNTVDLYLHVDKKVDAVSAQLGTIREVEIELKKTLERLEQRVDNGVARTGQENKTTLAEHSMTLNDMKHQMSGLGELLKGSTSELAKGIKAVGDRTDLIYKSIVAIFFSVLLAGFIGFIFKQLPIWFK